MESVIILAALILNPRARRRRQQIAGEGFRSEPHSCGIVDFTRSTTLTTTVNDNPCDVDVDIERKREKVQEKEETLPEGDQEEKAMVSGGGDMGVCNPSVIPASGTATVIEDLDR